MIDLNGEYIHAPQPEVEDYDNFNNNVAGAIDATRTLVEHEGEGTGGAEFMGVDIHAASMQPEETIELEITDEDEDEDFEPFGGPDYTPEHRGSVECSRFISLLQHSSD